MVLLPGQKLLGTSGQIEEAIIEEKRRSGRADHLMKFGSAGSPIFSFSERDYLELVDWTGRQARTDKPGIVSDDAPGVLEQLEIDVAEYLCAMDEFDGWFARAAGGVSQMAKFAKRLGKRWLRGLGPAGRLFG